MQAVSVKQSQGMEAIGSVIVLPREGGLAPRYIQTMIGVTGLGPIDHERAMRELREAFNAIKLGNSHSRSFPDYTVLEVQTNNGSHLVNQYVLELNPAGPDYYNLGKLHLFLAIAEQLALT
jgi:cell division protein FtsX